MIYATATVPVNPPGQMPLSRDQIWAGLMLKARDARQFLPPGVCTKCDVIAEGEGYFVREATILGDDLSEIITYEPQRKVSFHQFRSPREGVIVNQLIEQSDGSLHLKFYSLIGLKDVEPGGAEEQQEQAQMDSEDKGYKRALLSTLARTRQLATEGKL